MLKIDGKQKIKLTKGDTMALTVEILSGGEPYEPQEGDTCRFALSKGYLGEDDYELILEKNVPLDTRSFTVTAAESKELDYETYNYDVQLTYASGAVETFISSTLTITGEVE